MPPHEELHHWHKKASKNLRGGVPSEVQQISAVIAVFFAAFTGSLYYPNSALAVGVSPFISEAQKVVQQGVAVTTEWVHQTDVAFSGIADVLSHTELPDLQLAEAATSVDSFTAYLGSLWNSLFGAKEPLPTPPSDFQVKPGSLPVSSATNTPQVTPSGAVPRTTIINNQPVIERTVIQNGNGVSQPSLAAQLQALKDDLLARIQSINTVTYSAPLSIPFQAFAASQRIDQLSGTDLTNITVHGVSGLTAGDIPALSYFPATSTIAIAYGGTGTSTAPTYGKVLLGNTAGGYDLIATSSLGITMGGAATWGAITGTLSNQTDLQAALDGKFSLASWYATTTDGLTQGTTNKYWSNTLFDNRLSATTTLPNITTLANLGTVSTSLSGILKATSGVLSQAVAGTDYLTAATFFSYLFPNNATNTLLTFSGGMLSTASSTIGSGTQIGGLTVNGGATTTGNAYFAGNVGIATTSPTGRFAVQGVGTGTGTLFNLANSAFTTVLNVLDNGMAYVLGNFGIGTSTPWRKLSVTDTVASPQVAIAYDATRYAQLQVDSGGDLTLSAQGGDAYLTNENFFSCTSGCAAGNPTGTGNILAENKIGIGTTTPASKLTIETQDAVTNFLQIASSTAQSIFGIFANGRVGIATSTPWKQLSISGDGVLTGTLYLANGVSNIIPSTCPTGMIPVPGSAADGQQGFCVDKYEVKGATTSPPVSSAAAGTPLVSITQPNARAACIVAGKHLITEKEWQAIAHNVENVGWNWNGGVAGTNQMSDGHSDNVPANSLAADVTGAADDDPCVGTGQTCDLNTWSSQRRTYQLSNGEYIWDFGGDVWEWVDQTVTNDYPIVNSAAAGWQACSTSGDGVCGNTRTTNDQWYRGGFATIAGFLRGGDWGNGANDGAFALVLSNAPSYVYTGFGFRCAR